MFRHFNLVLFFLLTFIFSCSAQNTQGQNKTVQSVAILSENLESPSKEQAYKFILPDLKGMKVYLDSYLGSQEVLIFFWTTWCPFCRQAIRELTQEYPQIKSKNIEVLAINIDETPTRVERFISNFSPSFKILLDEGADVAEIYRVIGIPNYVWVDKNGYIKYQGNRLPAELKN